MTLAAFKFVGPLNPDLLLYGSLALIPLLGFLLWLWGGRGPRRGRAYKRAQRLVQQGLWREALEVVDKVKGLGRPSTAWEGRIRHLESECRRRAGDDALLNSRFEEALEQYRNAARLQDLSEKEGCRPVVEAMLVELRRLLATHSSPEPARAMAQRVLAIDPDCSEAMFWQGMGNVREGQTEAALDAFRASDARERALAQARGSSRARALDPLLYLGALLMREGRIQEALRHLSEAFRTWPESPFVSWQLGVAIVAAGGDSLAVRALQKALGPSGLPSWTKNPQRGWIEGLPGPESPPKAKDGFAGSFVRRMAEEHGFHCPVLGHDVPAMIRQGKLALAQAQYRLGHYADAADLFNSILQDSPPSLVVLRGLGMALVRQGHHDQAFKHLRGAYAMESAQPTAQTYQTAGYLALCGAKGKPNRPEDKPGNVLWAIRLLGQFDVRGDADWARLNSAVFAEARTEKLTVDVRDQVQLCDVLASVEAVDVEAAEAYESMAVADLNAIRPEHAWLYCRAAQVHNAGSAAGLTLFELTCREGSPALAFFQQHQWDFDEVAYVYLKRLADYQATAGDPATAPLPFEAALRPDHEQLLRSRADWLEETGDRDAAITAVEVLHTLAPNDASVVDRLASLHYRKGNLHRAAALLAEAHALDPEDPQPLLRRAVVEQQRGNEEGCFRAIARARERTRGKARAAVSFLGARLALAAYFQAPDRRPGHACWIQAVEFLDACLNEDAEHVEALWCLAALHAVAADRPALARLAPALDRPDVAAAPFQLLAAVCHLAAGDHGKAETTARLAAELAPPAPPDEAVGQVANPPDDGVGQVAKLPDDGVGQVANLPDQRGLWQVGNLPHAAPLPLDLESTYVIGVSRLEQHDLPAATEALRQVARTASPSADHARGLLGRLRFDAGDFEGAVQWWNAVEAGRRGAWKLDGPLRAAVMLTGLGDLAAERYEAAIARFREAERLGERDPRLGALVTRARVKAAQQLLAGSATADDASGVPMAIPITEEVLWVDAETPGAADLALQRHHAAESAVWLLKSAVQAGCQDPNVVHLLAQAYKQLGNILECRNTLRQVSPPDVFVQLQLGLLALRETKGGVTSPLPQAEKEFERAWELHAGKPVGENGVQVPQDGGDRRLPEETAAAYAAAYNLLLTRLSQGKTDAALPLVPGLLSVTAHSEERRRLIGLQLLLRGIQADNRDPVLLGTLAELTDFEEEGLLQLVRGLGQIDTSGALVEALAAGRPRSDRVRDARTDTILLRAARLFGHCDARAAERLLTPLIYDLARQSGVDGQANVAILNLLGCCACLLQDFEGAIQNFSTALTRTGNDDPRLIQNLALAHDFLRQHAEGEAYWNRYVDLLDVHVPGPPGQPEYWKALALECALRLAVRNYDKESWENALKYYERARGYRPDDAEILERLFHLNNQLRRPHEAREVLDRLKEIRADAPQLELYELEVQEVKTADDVLRVLSELERVVQKYPHDGGVADRSGNILSNLISFMESMEKRYHQQLRKTERSLRSMPSYQINWPEVHTYLRDVRARLAKLRRAADRCLGMVILNQQRTLLQKLRQHVEDDLELCRTLAG